MNEIRKLINIETKILDLNVSSTAFDSTGSLKPLSQVAQGTDYTQRVGDSIKVQHLELSYFLTINVAAVTTVCRILIVRDLDGYGTIPTTAQILETVGGPNSTTTPRKYLNISRFSVIYDDMISLNSSGDNNTIQHISIPMEKHVKYLGTTAANASDGKGSFYFIAISNQAVNTPTYELYSRLLFTDD